MKKNKKKILFGSLKVMVFAAILSAMSIVLGKYLAFNITSAIRISFENLPVIISGIFFGPFVGGAVGLLSDVVGSIMVGYDINPVICLGATLVGAVSGVFPLIFKRRDTLAVAISVAAAHVVGSLGVKTLGICLWYNYPYLVTLGWRALTYIFVGAAEFFIILMLSKNTGFVKQIDIMRHIAVREKREKMTYEQALEYIHSVSWKGSRPGLERTRELMQRLGNPQDGLKFVHVAGTNGKGSFCAMLSEILIKAGYKVGTYTSPYVLRFNERMKVDGEDISDEALAQITEYVRPFADGMQDSPTEFELITAIAMEYFAREGCDIVILECGMGGRLDSTNIIKTPILSVITGIALDHTAFLGDSIEKIAGEKAGIIKENIPVLFCSDNNAADRVIRERAEQLFAPYHRVVRDSFVLREMTLSGSVLDFEEYKNIKIHLLGTYQPHNACNVLTAVRLLQEQGIEIPNEAVYSGLETVVWHARFERLDEYIIFDGGHNPEGVDAALDSIKAYFPNKRVYIVTGVMSDKDYLYIATRISEVAEQVFCVTPDNPRALPAPKYAKVFEGMGIKATACESVKEAVLAAQKCAKENENTAVCLGSLYMYEEIYKVLH